MLDKELNGKEKYLIVAGTTKAATSSFYHYLSEHPDVAVTHSKECGYWLDTDYAHFSKNRFVEGEPNEYRSLFVDKASSSLLVDVSPDYLYSGGALERLMKHVPDSKFLFLLRDPISRVVSWFNFSRQMGFLPPEASLNAYIERMCDSGHQTQSADQYLQALQQGQYGKFLEPYTTKLSPERLKIVYYEDLKGNEQAIMTNLCEWLGINPEYFRDYQFEQRNRSTDYRSRRFHQVYHKLKRQLGLKTMQVPWIHRVFHRLRKGVEPVLLQFNSKPIQKADVISPELMQRLIIYYRNDMAKVNEICPVPQSFKDRYDLA